MKNMLRTLGLLAVAPLLLAGDQPAADILLLWRSDCAPCWQEATMLPDLARKFPTVHFTVLSLHGDVTHDHWPDNIDIDHDDTDAPFVRYGNMSKHLPFSVALHRDGSVCAGQDGLISETAIKMWTLQCAK